MLTMVSQCQKKVVQFLHKTVTSEDEDRSHLQLTDS